MKLPFNISLSNVCIFLERTLSFLLSLIRASSPSAFLPEKRRIAEPWENTRENGDELRGIVLFFSMNSSIGSIYSVAKLPIDSSKRMHGLNANSGRHSPLQSARDTSIIASARTPIYRHFRHRCYPFVSASQKGCGSCFRFPAWNNDNSSAVHRLQCCT